jgi:GTP-binding protein HflX
LRATIEDRLPWPAVEVRACVPYSQGGLLARVHSRGEVLAAEHTGDGTVVHARVDAALAAELAPFALTNQ